MSYPIREAAKVVGDCLSQQITPFLLPDPVTVVIGYQKININPKGLFIALFNLSSTIIPSESLDGSGSGLNEDQGAVILDTIQIDLLSFDDSARSCRAIAALALYSLNAEALNEVNQTYIAQKPGPFRDASSLEPTQYVQRYTTTVQTFSLQTYVLPAGYYSQFPNATEVINP